MHSYGITLQGTYHKKINLICQDAHYIKRISNNFIIASVADGLGSELHSDVASKIASEKSVEFCANNVSLNMSKNEIYSVIEKSYIYALGEIQAYVDEKNDDINQYDTTLSLAIFINDKVYYGHSGDGGIVVLKSNGEYKEITSRQRDDSGCVFPLCFGKEKWEFGNEDEVASVLLATDGVYDLLFPYLLFGEKINIYVALAQYFMDNRALRFDKFLESEVLDSRKAFLENLSDQQVNDDKTIVVLTNTKTNTQRQSEDYYKVPDWKELKRKKDEDFKRLAYPHLYSNDSRINK